MSGISSRRSALDTRRLRRVWRQMETLRYRIHRARAYWRAGPDEALELAAAEALTWRNVHVTLISRSVADEMRVWSQPVQFQIEPREGSLVVDVLLRDFPTEVPIS